MTVGIIGLGLIGGSVARALKKNTDHKIIAMNRSEASVKLAYKEGVIDEYTLGDLSAFSECDVIFICTSVDKIVRFAELLKEHIKKDCLITDVGSTKSGIVKAMKDVPVNFLGAHPMAGSEKSGYTASNEHLLENAYYIITPTSKNTDEQINKLKELITSMGAIPIILDCEHHDACVAAISHLPHIVASVLVNTVAQNDKRNDMRILAAGGFKDITRIASSSGEVWSSICDENREEILKILSQFSRNIEIVYDRLKNGRSLAPMFNDAKQYRDGIDESKHTRDSNNSVKISVADEVGVIAKVAAILTQNNINIKNIGIINNRDYSSGVLSISFENAKHKALATNILKQNNYLIRE